MTAKKIKVCANHPNVAAVETCAHCGKEICYNCVRIYRKKAFCSTACIRNFIFEIIDEKAPSRLRILLKILAWPMIHLLQMHKWHFLEWALLFGVMLLFIQNNQMNHKITDLQKNGFNLPLTSAPVDTALLPKPRVFKPVKGGQVTSNILDIEGEAEPNWIIALSINDEIREILLSKDSLFTFKRVALSRGDNHLQVKAMNGDGEMFVLQDLNLIYGFPHVAALARDFRRGDVQTKNIALTFDGGSENNVSDEILDYLKENHIKSTFFLTGEFIRQYPETVRRIVADGHEAGNHTWNHPHLTTFAENYKQTTISGMTKKRLQSELEKTASLFKMITGKDMAPLWRAPYGEYNPEILSWAAEAGYRHVGWTSGHGWDETMDSLDWVADKDSKAYHTADEITEKILNYSKNGKNGANGAIVLMHMGSNRTDDFPHKKLPEIISALSKDGYKLVTISEMMGE